MYELKVSFLRNSNFCVKYTLGRDIDHVLRNIAVANRWNYIRVLRESDDSFGEFRWKSVHRQSGYLLCNVAPSGGKWYRRRSGKAALYEMLLNRRWFSCVWSTAHESLHKFRTLREKMSNRERLPKSKRKRDRWRTIKILSRDTSCLYKSLPKIVSTYFKIATRKLTLEKGLLL